MITRLTPAFNFTWTGNSSASPHTLDLRPFEQYISQLPRDTSEAGMRQYLKEKLELEL
jgi:hypothetical protein